MVYVFTQVSNTTILASNSADETSCFALWCSFFGYINPEFTHLTVIHSSIYLYIHAGSPNATSLTFNRQSSTLTCNSTGGPATTVTWRKDGVVIALSATYQETKSLVDPVLGTYQTVLTIDPSVGQQDIVGIYNCTVENDRGASSQTVVVTGESSFFDLTTFCRHCKVLMIS